MVKTKEKYRSPSKGKCVNTPIKGKYRYYIRRKKKGNN